MRAMTKKLQSLFLLGALAISTCYLSSMMAAPANKAQTSQKEALDQLKMLCDKHDKMSWLKGLIKTYFELDCHEISDNSSLSIENIIKCINEEGFVSALKTKNSECEEDLLSETTNIQNVVTKSTKLSNQNKIIYLINQITSSQTQSESSSREPNLLKAKDVLSLLKYSINNTYDSKKESLSYLVKGGRSVLGCCGSSLFNWPLLSKLISCENPILHKSIASNVYALFNPEIKRLHAFLQAYDTLCSQDNVLKTSPPVWNYNFCSKLEEKIIELATALKQKVSKKHKSLQTEIDQVRGKIKDAQDQKTNGLIRLSLEEARKFGFLDTSLTQRVQLKEDVALHQDVHKENILPGLEVLEKTCKANEEPADATKLVQNHLQILEYHLDLLISDTSSKSRLTLPSDFCMSVVIAGIMLFVYGWKKEEPMPQKNNDDPFNFNPKTWRVDDSDDEDDE